jgi:hypothetical protein
MGMETFGGGRKIEPSLAEREEARDKQGVHDPDKAESMARASKISHDIAVGLKGDISEHVMEGLENSAEKEEMVGGIIHNLEENMRRFTPLGLKKLEDLTSGKTSFEDDFWFKS